MLINLGTNAVKFSNAGGKVTLDVSVNEQTDEEVELRFAVEDTGVGIRADQKENLFRAFHQADCSTTRKYGGTGLGLIISKNIVELMQGQIDVKSTEGGGSTFSFTARLNKQTQAEPRRDLSDCRVKEQAKKASTHLRGARVLLVEDNEINQMLAEEVLTQNGMVVAKALNGQEALELLATQDFDGILMDCQMPVMDGYEATRKVREQDRHRELPIIAMTANAMKGDKQKVLDVGMNDHIVKPFDPDTVLITMAQWITPTAH